MDNALQVADSEKKTELKLEDLKREIIVLMEQQERRLLDELVIGIDRKSAAEKELM